MNNTDLSGLRPLTLDSVIPPGHLLDIVRAATAGDAGEPWRSALRCRRRPARRACPGRMMVTRTAADAPIHWSCDACGDAGTVVNWTDSLYDLRRRGLRAAGDSRVIALSDRTAAALRDLQLLDPYCERLVFSIRAGDTGALLVASAGELDELINAVAAEANHEPGAARRLDAAFNVLDRAADGFWPLPDIVADVAVTRMNREQFFSAMSGHDDAQLRTALWNLYWRGTADVRRRIEAELAGNIRPAVKPEPLNPQAVHDEVAQFVALARSGAYLGRDRRVSPKERTRWRFTFKQLATAAVEALHASEPTPAITALAQLIDPILDARDTYYFRSEDPVSAAGFVVSDAAAAMWNATWRRHGFQRFAETAAPQLIR